MALINNGQIQAKLDFQNKFNRVFHELYTAIELDGVSIQWLPDADLTISINHKPVGTINTQWLNMGKLRIDGVDNLTHSQSSTLFRLLQSHGLAA